MFRWIAEPASGILKALCARLQLAAIVGGDTREPSGMRRASNTRRSCDEVPERSAPQSFDRQLAVRRFFPGYPPKFRGDVCGRT
jgi:hypothetical protein